ncbi:hypothetical protein V757_10950 [Pelistega indica]|uniref:Cytochrome c assembly protein domain-containing protein n=1 Tax=Pelistega indica TaxID=1414851 RepID=V8FTW4_9BURK|nr:MULTISPECIES: cytochrome c biogenesis protein CcsA [Pelistega]ETD67729.1 hypothetical protein V757_10950 [Pelistega indica]
MMSSAIVLHYLAALAYLGLGISIWWALYQKKPLTKRPLMVSIILFGLIIVQGFAIHLGMLADGMIRINWTLGLSFTLWLGLMIYWVESNFIRLTGFLLLLLPIGFIICLLAAIFPISEHSTSITVYNNTFMVHLVISLFAYSLIALSALQALIMTGLDNYLHRPQNFSDTNSLVSRILDAQPPLMVQERLLFRLIWIGFTLLSLSILSGMYVSIDLTGQLLPHDHKTFFTLISWLIFGILLFGRMMWGWRGRIALRWTMLGFGLLMLAYTGTRFIFEELITK